MQPWPWFWLQGQLPPGFRICVPKMSSVAEKCDLASLLLQDSLDHAVSCSTTCRIRGPQTWLATCFHVTVELSRFSIFKWLEKKKSKGEKYSMTRENYMKFKFQSIKQILLEKDFRKF